MSNIIISNTYNFYIIYETLCKINGKTYIGCHATNILDDGYLGSGKHLLRAIKKYGKEQFTRTILHYFDNPTDMFLNEKLIVNEAYVNSKNTYNLVIGGSGGFKVQDITDWKKKLRTSSANRVNKTPMKGKLHTAESKLKISEANTGRAAWNFGLPGTWIGKTHTEDSKLKISRSRKGLTAGDKNPMFGKSAVKGRKWFNNGVNTFYLFPDDSRIVDLSLKTGRLPKQVS